MADTFISAHEAARRTRLSTGALAKRRYLKEGQQRLGPKLVEPQKSTPHASLSSSGAKFRL